MPREWGATADRHTWPVRALMAQAAHKKTHALIFQVLSTNVALNGGVFVSSLEGTHQRSHPLPSTTQKCGVSSFSRVARVRATRENDLAATIQIELATALVFFTAAGKGGLPVFGTQFHPESVQWDAGELRDGHIVPARSIDAIRSVQYLANVFVQQARNNSHA